MFKRGEKVVVCENGWQYDGYPKMANVMELDNYRYREVVENGAICEVIAKSYHRQETTLLYGIQDIKTGQQYIISEDGLEAWKETKEEYLTPEEFLKLMGSEDAPRYFKVAGGTLVTTAVSFSFEVNSSNYVVMLRGLKYEIKDILHSQDLKTWHEFTREVE